MPGRDVDELLDELEKARLISSHFQPSVQGFVPALIIAACGWIAEGFLKGLGTDIYNRLLGQDVSSVIDSAVRLNAELIKSALDQSLLEQSQRDIRDLETTISAYNNAKETSLDRLERATELSNTIVSNLESLGTSAFSSFTLAIHLQLSVLQERRSRFGNNGEKQNMLLAIGRWQRRASEETPKLISLGEMNPASILILPSFRDTQHFGQWIPGVLLITSPFVRMADNIYYKESFKSDKKAAKKRDAALERQKRAFYEAYCINLLGDIFLRQGEMNAMAIHIGSDS
jgi:hypothetical protein